MNITESLHRCCVAELAEHCILSRKLAEKLVTEDQKKPNWYFLPKIHKRLVNPPGKVIA